MYQLDKDKLNAFAQYFTDDVYSELKSGVTSSDGIADADVKALVEAMLADNEYKKFRVGEYEAYETLGTLQQRLKTKHQYSRYENPTGVYFTAGQSYLVAVSGIEDDAVGLKVKNWYQSESSSTYSLRNGLNYITATTEGNVFVNYYTDNYAEAPEVKVHFINAPVIGYWDQETMTNADWVALLDDKESDDHRIIITQSEHAQTAFPISAWKTHCPDDVETLMGYYQDVQWAIRDMMGLEKYGYQTRNRQIFYVVNGGFMAAGAEGAFCNYSSLGGIMNPNSFDFWGVGHEWGHNNQIDPGFYWSGCGETTNNIYASWAQYHFTPHRDDAENPYNLRLEDEKSGIDEYSDMRGGRMQTYFEEAVRKGVAWQLQDGPDYHNATPGTKTVTGRDADGNDIGEVITTSRNYDHFVKLTPFWQLNLWGNLAEKCPDIITDVIHSIRTAENYTATYNTNGKQQINWMKLACDHAGIDLLPFFEKAGMLVPIHAYIEDYGAGWNIITEEMINELKAYVAQKGYPAYTEEINYINAHNMHIYRDNLKLNVTGMQGELNGDKLIVQHSVAQNAVAFETYNAQDELIRITMYGLGSNDEHSFTQVLFPSDAAYVMAVGYDGERQMVYKVRTADELQTLISEAESLLSTVGSVNNPVAQKVELTADNYYCNALYTAEDNGDKFTSYEVLRDGNPSTYLHTDYSGNAPSENHYVTIDLGSGNELTFFNLNYTTRNEGYACAPTQVVVEASNDNKTWVTLRSVTSGLNSANNAQNTIAELGDGTPYRYIRMTVLETSTSTDYFVLSEMGLSELSYDVNLQPSYSLISTGVVVAAHLALQSAQEVVNNGTDYTTAYIALQKSVDALLAAREEMDKLNEQKASLRTLIGSTNSLIAQCGTVTFNAATPDTELALQTSNESGYYYLSTNANEPLEGSLDNLIDTSDDTYFHSAWSWDVNAVHYLKVDMGEGKSLKEFTFTYKTTKGLFPKVINVYGSNDDSQGELLHTFTKDNDGLPTAVGSSWTSSVISSEAAYRYIRFEVTESDGGGYGATPKGEYCFVMSYFGITEMAKPEGYTVTLGNEAGGVTRELMIATYEAVQEALSVVDYANTEAQVNEAIDKLQAQYNALEKAKNAAIDFTISSNIAGGGVRYQDVDYTTTLSAPSTLEVDDLDRAVEVEGYVAKSITINGTEISIIYNKVYTVTITGGEGQGSVTFADTEYENGGSFDVEQNSFTDDALTVKDVEGYNSEVTVNHETGAITVVYTLNTSALSTLIEETNVLMQACQVFVNSAYVTEQLLTNTSAAITSAMETLSKENLTYAEYTEALTALQTANTTLTQAKISAEAEAAERNEKREALSVLIGQTIDLINLCEENPGDATTALINEVSVAVTLAQSVVDNQGSTEDELNSTIDDLQAKYAVLDAAQQSTAKAELRELIAQTQALIAECGTYGNGEHMVKTPVTLQVDHEDGAYYLFTNADHNVVGGGAKDGDGIAALIDGNVNTYMHTQWGGNPVTDDHYVQVNLGNDMGLAEFAFTYATRKGSSAIYTSPAPTIIEVYGSSDGETFDAQIARFTSSDETNPLISYTELGEYWASENIKPSRNYGYLRFYVRKSAGPQSSTQYGDRYYFAMSEFALSAVSYETSYYVESLTSYGNVTEEQFLNVARAYDAANDLVENSYDKVELVNAKNNLQAYYDVLMAAHNDYSYLPVTLTTDVENPVLYVMNSKRGAGKVLQYNAGDNDFTIVDATKVNEMVETNASQLFYFTKGTEKGQVYVHPFTAEGQVLAASDKDEGADKVFVAEMDNEYAMQWTFVNATIDDVEWYSLKGVDDAPYFSHHGGGTNKMGFYGSEDEGSRFTFTEKKSHKVTIGQYQHTSLYLNYATTIPEGVKAYIAKNPSEEGTIDLVKLQDGVLPANTGVILYSETPGTYYFLATNASATDDVNENLLKGSASAQYVGGDDTKNYYIFGQKAGVVGLYGARMDYDADGNKVEGEDNGTHFKASANKVYLELDATSGVALSGFRFRVGGDETGIEGITIDADATIYDLYGRRIVEVVTPGIYIINGEKHYINIK